MATTIAFNDGAAASLSNGRAVPFDRFWSWTPDSQIVGDSEVTLGDGITNTFEFRTDYFAKLEVRFVPESALVVANRLKRHLLRGGTCTVDTGDGVNTYTARLRPGTTPSIELADEGRRHFTVKLELKNTAAAEMACSYAP